MLKVQAAVSWTSGGDDVQSVLQSLLCLSVDVQTAGFKAALGQKGGAISLLPLINLDWILN